MGDQESRRVWPAPDPTHRPVGWCRKCKRPVLREWFWGPASCGCETRPEREMFAVEALVGVAGEPQSLDDLYRMRDIVERAIEIVKAAEK